MTIGIYALYFNTGDENNVYIGQSTNIERRYSYEHVSRLIKGTHENRLIQGVFTSLGTPELLILEETTELDTREMFYIDLYSSYPYGLNLSIGGTGYASGDAHPDALYPETVYYSIIKLLAEGRTTQQVAEILQVSIYVVRSIRYREKHCYLAEKYPEVYTLATSVTQKRGPNTSNKSYSIKSPIGEVFHITNVNAFAKEHGLDQSNLRKLLIGTKNTYKGWTPLP